MTTKPTKIKNTEILSELAAGDHLLVESGGLAKRIPASALKQPGLVFDTVADMETYIAAHADKLSVGMDLFIREEDAPDYWWDGEKAVEVETDLSVVKADIAGLKTGVETNSKEIGEISDEIAELYNYGETEQIGYLRASGKHVNDTNTHSITTNVLKSAPGLTYKYKGYAADSAVSVIFYDENMGILSTGQYDSRYEYTDIVTPENTAFVVFSSFAMLSTAVVFSVVIPTGYGGIVYDLRNEVISHENRINDLENNTKNNINKEHGNLWNGEYVSGYFITPQGTIKEYSGYAYTEMVYLQAGTYLINAYKPAYGGNTGNVYRTDEEGNITSVIKSSYDSERDISMLNLEDGYYRFNCGNRADRIQNFMVIAGDSFDDWPATVRPYGSTYVERDVRLNDAMRKEVSELLPTYANPLSAKTIAFEGDSICAGAGFSGGYGKIIAERNDMTYYNTAVGGGVMPSGILTSSGSERHGIAAGVAAMNPDADYLIFEGGVNDASLDLTLGEIVDGYPVQGDSDTIDTTTFLGAFEFACRELVTTFAGKKVGYIFVHGIFASDHRWNSTWRGKMKEILVKWGVPYIDLQEEVPPLNLIPVLKSSYTKDGDGWHPNEDGYKKYYCDKIEAWLRTL